MTTARSANRGLLEARTSREIITVVEEFTALTGLSAGAIMFRALSSDRAFFDRVKEGRSFNVRTYDRLMGYLSDEWPKGKRWPTGIKRPRKRSEQASEEKPLERKPQERKGRSNDRSAHA